MESRSLQSHRDYHTSWSKNLGLCLRTIKHKLRDLPHTSHCRPLDTGIRSSLNLQEVHQKPRVTLNCIRCTFSLLVLKNPIPVLVGFRCHFPCLLGSWYITQGLGWHGIIRRPLLTFPIIMLYLITLWLWEPIHQIQRSQITSQQLPEDLEIPNFVTKSWISTTVLKVPSVL